MTKEAKVITFKEAMASVSPEEMKESIRVWQEDQDKLAKKLEIRKKDMFNRPMAKALSMVRANRKG